MNKQILSQSLRQTLTSRQIAQIKLLELPVRELAQRIEEELIVNPALEQVREETSVNKEEEEIEENKADLLKDDYLTEDDIPDYKLKIIQDEENLKGEYTIPNDSKSLQQYLLEQLSLLNLSDKETLVGEQIIGNVGDDGYLRVTEREVEDYLLFYENEICTSEEFNRLLAIIQSFDPPGVAARGLQESLLLQLKRLSQTSIIEKAEKVLENYFEELANRRYEQICSKLGITIEEFQKIQKVITSLNPKPGNGFGSDFTAIVSRVVPDFVVRARDNGFDIWLNEEGRIPKLQLNSGFVALTEEKIKRNKEKKEEIQYAKQQIYNAKWFIEAVELRRKTLLRTMEVIVSLQTDFFQSGNIHDIKPMVLQDVADRTGHDVSTISRIGNEKFVETEFGIYPIKFFFSEGTTQQDGKEISSRSIKALLEDIIEHEDKKHPYSDEKIVSLMKGKGVSIARRTLAKYRDQLGILPARLRRRL